MKTLSVLDTCLDLIISKDQGLKTDLTASSHCGLPCKLSSWSEAVLCFLLSYLLLSDLVVEWLNSKLWQRWALSVWASLRLLGPPWPFTFVHT